MGPSSSPGPGSCSAVEPLVKASGLDADSGSAQPMRDMDWLGKHVAEDAHVTLTDVTWGWTVLSVMGPNSRALLQKVSRADFSNEGFPFATIREVGVGHATVLASRRTYMGELGWELYVPVEFAVTVFETLHGGGCGVRPARYRLLRRREPAPGEGLPRLGPRAHAGRHALAGRPRLGGEARQAGRLHRPKALVEAKGKPLARRLVSVVLEDGEPLLWGGETLLREGKPVGDLSSAGYGHTVGASVGLGYVRRGDGAAIDAAWLEQGKFEVDLAGTRLKARPSLRRPTIRPERAHQGLSFLQPRVGELAGRLEDRIGDRGQVAVDALEVADHVDVDRAGLDRFRPALAQPGEVAVGRLGLGLAHRRSFRRPAGAPARCRAW